MHWRNENERVSACRVLNGMWKIAFHACRLNRTISIRTRRNLNSKMIPIMTQRQREIESSPNQLILFMPDAPHWNRIDCYWRRVQTSNGTAVSDQLNYSFWFQSTVVYTDQTLHLKSQQNKNKRKIRSISYANTIQLCWKFIACGMWKRAPHIEVETRKVSERDRSHKRLNYYSKRVWVHSESLFFFSIDCIIRVKIIRPEIHAWIFHAKPKYELMARRAKEI